MATWQEFIEKEGHPPDWPYPIRYETEQEIETDVLVLGGGIAGCWAAISAARKGVKVAMVEKGATIRSGAGGAGCDHWQYPVTSPLTNVDPDEYAQKLADAMGGYSCGIGRQIQCRESYDTLLELEEMGGKIRDYDNEYKDTRGRDEKTKLMLSPRFQPANACFRVWGTTFKPALKKECERLGVQIFDRVMATSLLTEGGIQGARVIGATGVNNRTGEFIIFKAKATVLCTAGTGSIWIFNTELAGITTFRPRTISGDGAAMVWRAGGCLNMMESTSILNLGTGMKHHWYGGAGDASYENVPIVDADGKRLPVRTQGWDDVFPSLPLGERGNVNVANPWDVIREGVLKGEYTLPFYGDFPGMIELERNATWGLMIGEESTTKIILKTYNDAGFDPSKHLLQNYQLIEGRSLPQWRSVDGASNRGGILIDWDMKTTLDGLYAAGDGLPVSGDHSFAATTGRYAGRKAADYARQIDRSFISKDQVALEKARIFAPTQRSNSIEWKELHGGIARAMQYFCSEYKTESLLKMGLDTLKEIEENYVPKLYALDPHKLMRSLEDMSILTYAQIITQASLARKASSRFLDFHRIDYPEIDPLQWNKFIILRLENNKVKMGELPLDYWGNLKTNYEARNKEYKGVYTGK